MKSGAFEGDYEVKMAKDDSTKTAREIIDQFFSGLEGLEGMDKDTAIILQQLWNEGKLGRDELLSELENARAREGIDDSEKA
jgi:hypothetical protein